MDQKKIGSFLKALRKEKGLTQEELAIQFNVSNRTVSRWETGNNMPDISLLVEISEFYDVDLREIINGERTSENMNEETKETVLLVADYEQANRDATIKKVTRITFVGLIFLLLHLVLDSISIPEDMYILDYLTGVCAGVGVGTILMNLLFITNRLEKLQTKKKAHMKVIKVVCITIIIVTFTVCLLATIL